ncbi:dermonecrotic toxin domain-containing protein [Herbaspirillum autotrophicum]|uniref:dermonecrotic toxin domain-containing protein n=1 Tax=Herbaspirillum autotrophicum TaxID=180195 RepID=UPI00067AD6E3|nr:DUF6543 domain-containing protein [Herbaspirillum autotrophicum]
MIKAERSIAASNDVLSAAVVPSDEFVHGSHDTSAVVRIAGVGDGTDPVLMTGLQDPTYATSIARAREQIRVRRSAASPPQQVAASVTPPAVAGRFPDRISNSVLHVTSRDKLPGSANEQEQLWAIRQNRLEAIALTRNFPQPTAVAARWLRQHIKDLYGQDVDPDTCHLVRFKEGSLTSNSQGIPDAACTLSEVAASGADGVRGWKSCDIAELNSKFGIYKHNRPEAAYDMRQQIPLQASELKDLLRGYDRNLEYEHAVKIFWEQHRADYRRLLADSFNVSLMQQHRDGKLSESSFNLIQQSLQNAGFQGQVFSFDLAGNRAADMLRFRIPETNRVVLYMPGQQYPFHEFNSEGKLREWVAALATSKSGREQIGSHFSSMQRELHGVNAFLKRLAETPLERKKINQIDRFGTSGIMHDFLPRLVLWGVEKSLQDAQFGIARLGSGNDQQQAASVLAPLLAAPDSRTARTALTVLASQSMAQEFDTFLEHASARGLRKNKLNAVLGAFSVPQVEDPVQIRKRLERIEHRMARVDEAYRNVALQLQAVFKPGPHTMSMRSARAAQWALKQAHALQEIGIPGYRNISAPAWSEAIRQMKQTGVSAGKLDIRTLADQAFLLNQIPQHLWGEATNDV